MSRCLNVESNSETDNEPSQITHQTPSDTDVVDDALTAEAKEALAALDANGKDHIGLMLRSRYELPRRLEIVPALPRNATGKILKAQLRNQFGRIGNTSPLSTTFVTS